MAKSLSLNFYTQANAGIMNNVENATYSNLGTSAGFNVNANFDGKNKLYYSAEVGAGTALTANAEIGYKRALNKNSNLVFGAKFSYDKSLTRTDSYNVNIDNSATVNGKKYQLDLINENYNWKPDNLQYGGKIGFNKETKWGEYEIGAEAGYRTNSSPEFYKSGGSSSTFDLGDGKTQEHSTHYEYGRKRSEGMYASPYAAAKVNLTANKALQAIGKADTHEVKIGLRYNF